MPTKQVAWVTQGPLAGRVLQMETADFEKAQKDGWAVPFKRAAKTKIDRAAENKAAEKYASKLPGYATRELRAEESPAPEPAATGSAAGKAEDAAPKATKAPVQKKTPANK